jgi:hypothetical protein
MSFAFIATNGNLEMDIAQDDSVLPDIAMSLSIKKGAWFFRPDFGLEPVRVGGPTAPARLKANIEAALQWIVDAQRASAITVFVERDVTAIDRLNYRVTATQADGAVVRWESFEEVR